ncbi:MAG TPA: YfiR family protein [Bryobacteraceae bacterium]|nr:YfiR family protein [Bryobacteraceae bacterium]
MAKPSISKTYPALLAACVVPLGLLLSAATELPQPEDELKAAVVLSFVRYAEWPQMQPGNSAITIGVFGRPSFARVLRRTLEGKSVNDRAVRIVELKAPADWPTCQVIYFATDRAPEIKQGLLGPHPRHALTIGESKAFLDEGGAVNLLLVDGHMSFEVSREALERSGISISSKLLRFGQIRGHGKGEGPG